jgi:hypothetical protein
VAASASAETSLDASGSALVERDEDGLVIDWTHLWVRVTGTGMAPERGTLPQRRLFAKRTAFADGYHRLSDALDGIRVNSQAYVRDLTAVDDAARLAVNDMIREARATDTNYWADGSVEVTLQLDLGGPHGLARAVLGAQASMVATPSVTPKSKPSGAVLDARGTGAQPALRPRVRDAKGQAFTPDDLPFHYLHLPEGARVFSGNNPLKLKVKRAYGPTHADLLLNDREADQLKNALRGDVKLPITILL